MMLSASSSTKSDSKTTTTASAYSSLKVSSSNKYKRLLFDRRYGWVVDDWKDTSQEALAGGRGMFCLLPLAKAFLAKVSQSINLATSSAVKVLERSISPTSGFASRDR